MDEQEYAAEAIYQRAINRGIRVAVAASEDVPGAVLPTIAADSALNALADALYNVEEANWPYVIAYLRGRAGGWVERYSDDAMAAAELAENAPDARSWVERESGGTIGSL